MDGEDRQGHTLRPEPRGVDVPVDPLPLLVVEAEGALVASTDASVEEQQAPEAIDNEHDGQDGRLHKEEIATLFQALVYGSDGGQDDSDAEDEREEAADHCEFL